MRRQVMETRFLRAIVLTLGFSIFLLGCDSHVTPGESQDTSTSGSSTFQIGTIYKDQPSGEPMDGGTLDFSVFAEAPSLDPAQLAGASGVFSGAETAALYDVLMRYNPETGDYEPHMAKEIEHSDNYTTWTLTLRDGVLFSNGNLVDAQAVKFSIERYLEADVAQGASVAARFIDEIRTPNKETVVFHLSQPWTDFPYVLSVGGGMIVSPAAIKKTGEEFGSHPVGAGPFVLERFAPGEELVLAANPDYWGGRPHIDRLRFVPNLGAQAKLEALNTSGLDAAFLRDAGVITDALEQGYFGYIGLSSAGESVVINSGGGRPGADVRVRKAISYAIDPQLLDHRAYSGDALAGKALFLEPSRWYTDVESVPYDPDKAKRLLKEAMQSGYDGRLELVYPSATAQQRALAVQALLDTVGFTVELKGTSSLSDFIRLQVVERNYDIAIGGVGIYDSTVYTHLYASYVSKQNYRNFQNDGLSELINRLSTTANEEDKRQIVADIQRQYNEVVPGVPTAATREFIAWDEGTIHGVVATVRAVLLFHDAWMRAK